MSAQSRRDDNARRSRQERSEVSDIGDLPEVVDPDRKEACRYDLFLFLTTYFPNSTGLKPFSDDHKRVIDRIQRCILNGGRFVNAVYRGFAKTTISENAAIWAVLYGHRKFVPLFGADQSSAAGNIDSIKRELEGNDLLFEDFPEVCHAIRCLEGKPQRQHSQHYHGERTYIGWTADTIVLPTIPDSAASGAILGAYGLTGASRGAKHKRPDGTQQRPDFVIIDDPQTDESANSPLQVHKRLAVIKKTVLKLAGHGKTLAVVMNATVIAPDDLVDQLLDQKKNAAWQGERIKMVRKWADAHETLWLKDYSELRTTYDKDDPEAQKRAHLAATEFYLANRRAMDRGCIVSWEHCYDLENEASAIQHAYNALIDDGPDVFASEFQNEPLPMFSDAQTLSADEIAAKVSGYERYVVPQECQRLTGFIDVQKEALFYGLVAWVDDFTGYAVDYGCYPEQKLTYFSLRDLKKRLVDSHPGTGFEGSLLAGLTTLTDQIVDREWIRDDGTRLHVERLMIDANWNESTDLVYRFCRSSKHANIVMPSHGIGVGAASAGLNDRKRKEGERRGLNWRIPTLSSGRPVRHVIYDTNFWKSFLHKRLATAYGDRGSLVIFNGKPAQHRMLAEQLTAEYRVPTQGWGRQVEEWKLKPGRPDNHLLDCFVGCCVAASIQGVSLTCQQEQRPIKRQRRAVQYF